MGFKDKVAKTGKRSWVWGCGVVALLVVGGLAAAAVLSYVDYPVVALRSGKVVQEYRATGMPWVAEDVFPDVPAEDNASPEFLAMASSGKPWMSDETRRIQIAMSKYDYATAKKELAGIEDQLAEFEAASRVKTLYFEKDWDMNSHVRIPEFAVFKSAVRTLGYRAEVRASDGDLEGALSDLRTGWRLGHLIGNQPTNIGLLVGIACEAIIFRASLDVAGVRQNDEAWIARVRKEIDGWDQKFEATIPRSGDIYMRIALARNLTSRYAFITSGDDWGDSDSREDGDLVRNGIGAGAVRQAYLTRFLESSIGVKRIADAYPGKPYRAGLEIDQFLKKEFYGMNLSDPYIELTQSNYAQLGAAIEKSWVMPELNSAILRAGEVRAKTGSWPTTWEELGVEPVIDPLTEMPAVISIRKNQFVISLKKPSDEVLSNQNLDFLFPTTRRAPIEK